MLAETLTRKEKEKKAYLGGSTMAGEFDASGGGEAVGHR